MVDQTHPDIGVVSIDHDAAKALDLIEDLKQRSPDCSILVISGSTDGQIILKAMRAGAKEFLTQPVRMEDLVTAIQRIGQPKPLGCGDGRFSFVDRARGGRCDGRRRVNDESGSQRRLRAGQASGKLRGAGRFGFGLGRR